MNVSVQGEKDGVRVSPVGEIDMSVAPHLRKVLHKILTERPHRVTVDLSDVTFIDSAGIATIVEVLKLSRQRGSLLKVEGCQEAVRDTFDIAGLTTILDIR